MQILHQVLEELNPALKEMLPHLFTETHTSDTKAGELTPEWADRLGLPQGIAGGGGGGEAPRNSRWLWGRWTPIWEP